MDPQRPSLLVIFGAGASFDSADADSTTAIPLPLAIHLVAPGFSQISQKYPPAQPIIDRLRRRLARGHGATSLESEMALLANNGSPDRRGQMMAFRFYLHDVIQTTAEKWLAAHFGYTRYLTLFDEIAEWRQQTQARVDVVTFNYDLLVEQALASVVPDWAFGGDLRDYVNRPDFRLFKLHGSTQWSRPVNVTELAAKLGRGIHPLVGQSTLPAAIQMAAAGISLAGLPIELVRPEAKFDGSSPVMRIPALAIPVEGKMDFECPPAHVDILKAALPDLTHVLIIGWRGAEQHAIKLLEGEGIGDGLMPGYALGIVSDSGEHATETRMNLGTPGARGRQILTVDSGFKGLIEDELRTLDNFLRCSWPEAVTANS